MTDAPPATPQERLRTAFELHEFGVLVYRQRMRREHPNWEDDQVDAEVRRWLASSPPQGPPAPPERWRRLGLVPPRTDP